MLFPDPDNHLPDITSELRSLFDDCIPKL